MLPDWPANSGVIRSTVSNRQGLELVRYTFMPPGGPPKGEHADRRANRASRLFALLHVPPLDPKPSMLAGHCSCTIELVIELYESLGSLCVDYLCA